MGFSNLALLPAFANFVVIQLETVFPFWPAGEAHSGAAPGGQIELLVDDKTAKLAKMLAKLDEISRHLLL